MQLYLYSSQDLIIQGNCRVNLNAGDIYRIKLNTDEQIFIYPVNSAGIMVASLDILKNQQHSQINFYKLSDDAMLCEIKPFINNEDYSKYSIKNTYLKLINMYNKTYISFNGKYCGIVDGVCTNTKFKKVVTGDTECGVITFGQKEKYIILFNNEKIIYCGQYIDTEITKQHIQIYAHNANIFNVGELIKYEFQNDKLTFNCVCDKEEYKPVNPEFNIICFLEAVKCRRFKLAYSKLSYELKSEIDIEVLQQYFQAFDNYIFLPDEDVYVTLKNNKVIGVYHFAVNNNFIENIY